MDLDDSGEDVNSYVFQLFIEGPVFPKHYARCSRFTKKLSTPLPSIKLAKETRKWVKNNITKACIGYGGNWKVARQGSEEGFTEKIMLGLNFNGRED